MAHLVPDLPKPTYRSGRDRELDVLYRLQSSLPDGYEIFHNVSWHTLHNDRDKHGEIDIVVLSPIGNVLLVEIKAGDVSIGNGQMIKAYHDGSTDVGRQTKIQFAAMVDRLSKAKLNTHVTNCLVLPDYVMGNQQIVALPPERIIDATRFDQLGALAREMMATEHSGVDVESLRRFFSNEFNVTLDMRVLGEQVRTTTLRLADGLATWIPRISAPSGLIRIQATAGSGKTQLALKLLQDAADKSQLSLYVCYNRSLADHIGHIAPTKAKVASFHELCVEHYRQTVGEPDFAAPGNYDRLAAQYCDSVETDPKLQKRYQLIVLDEGQDFQPAWVAALLPQLTDDGKIYLLEDDAQRLYDREEFDLSDVVNVTCLDNFRTPKAVCKVINALGLTEQPIVSRSFYRGELPNFYTYTTDSDLLIKTEAAVTHLLQRGIALADIAIISWKGLTNSQFNKTAQLGAFTLRRPTGKYSVAGDAIWTTGDLLVDSVYRFKGQSASGIVLTEIDFGTLDDKARRKLFVGLTRAQLAVEVVLTEQAASFLTTIL
ncbi:AAA domain-containing protein [Jezberella montanilacus]|jgi:hypothetical protein|uniref:AAA domain-containing protein n=1 Tax=Jezberella montanilacus TaxID=323426 RepID=A0A2T0XBZ3_9BURK|nr:NERD domain-containing protein/DEAD/DEAH box helicase [Jezberella montanilacus]PRY96448.1 AAA domain-containing protein [Jezberella montanilacus]|eukprot:gene8028-8104_t